MKTLLALLLLESPARAWRKRFSSIFAETFTTPAIIDSASQNLTVNLGKRIPAILRTWAIPDNGIIRLNPVEMPNHFRAGHGHLHGQADSIHPTKFASIGTAKGLALELADPQDRSRLPRTPALAC
jgi:minor fimbrial subunit